MSIVDDQVRRLDALLDKYQYAAAASRRQSSTEPDFGATDVDSHEDLRASKLTSLVRSLSSTSSSRPLLSKFRLRNLLSDLANESTFTTQSQRSTDDFDLGWLAAGKATVQLYGTILNVLLEQTIPLSESIWYWDDVLGSYLNTGLYTVQTSPERFWKQAKEVYADAKEKFQSDNAVQQSAQDARNSIVEGWKEFYAIVQNTIQERSLSQARTRILSPFAICRMEARRKQSRVKRLRETNATAIGLLVDEGLAFQPVEEENGRDNNSIPDRAQWQSTVAKSVSLLENVLRNATSIDNTIAEFEDNVFASVDGDPEFVATNSSSETTTNPAKIAARLLRVLDENLPDQEQGYNAMSEEFGKPPRAVRYWIPAVLLLLSGSTLLRIVANRRAEIIQWFRDFGTTVRDFWLNWVVEPTRKLVGTIRHDEQSEIAIMSKDSLKADRESLERMVVEFAVAHPENGSKYSEPQIAEIRTKVKEGDLTPVLKAYEREMQSPIKNAIMGDLVRTLLIQVQKTKVDVEVAIGGIDSLLKSQELLFGFVGIAPGVLISYFVVQWVRNSFGGRRGLEQNRKKGETIRLLRNIDRDLSNATPTQSGLLSYKDHGLLLCEANVLRQRAAAVLPGNIQREFLEDLDDLMDVRIGIDRQIRVLERIRWAYGKWLQ